MIDKTLDQETTSTTRLAQEGKYLTFALGKEDYGIEILKVREIIGMINITSIPHMPNYVKGVINLRGKVIPVINLRLKFGMPEIEAMAETCIIVITINDLLIGLIIDRVREVLDIKQNNIEPPPNFNNTHQTDFILGMGKVGDKVKILLNIEKILGDDMAIVARTTTDKNTISVPSP